MTLNHKSKLKKKLTAYSSLAATLVAGGVHEAEAQIIYVDIPDQQVCASVNIANNIMKSYPSSIQNILFDIDGQNISVVPGKFKLGTATDLLGAVFATARNSIGSKCDNIWAGASLGAQKKKKDNVMPEPLACDDIIGSNTSFVDFLSSYIYAAANCAGSNTNSISNSGYSGNFISGIPNNQSGYIGFDFDINGDTHFGWLQIKVEQDFNIDEDGVPDGEISAISCITILDYAYNSVAGEPIKVCEGQVQVEPIPTMGQWGLICLNLLLMIFGVTAVRERNSLVLQKK